MTVIIDGKKIRDEILAEVKQGVSELSFVPIFCDVLVGSDPASEQYVRMKNKAAREVGIETYAAVYPGDVDTLTLVSEIEKLNATSRMCGLIIQLPLPAHIDTKKVLDAIDPSIDVDCLSNSSRTAFYQGEKAFVYPTALACLAVIDSLPVENLGRNIVVLGQGQLVGKPVTHLLRSRGYAVHGIDTSTQNTLELLKRGDVLISAIGKPGYVKGDMLKNGVIVIDAGTSEATNSIVGDVDASSVEPVASFLSPVPGGVGPVTVAMLLKNVLIAAQHKK